MKYLTKEWYWWEKAIISLIDIQIESRAASFSEELYHELYEERKNNSIFWGVSKDRFSSEVDLRMEHLSRVLNQELRDKIADFRVFALGYATKQIVEETNRYVKKAMAENSKRYDTCWDERRRLFADKKPGWLRAFSFHDFEVEKAEFYGNDLSLTIIPPHDYGLSVTQAIVKQVTFCDADVIEQELSLVNALWKYDEVYPLDKGYEIHVLFERDGIEPLYLTLTCDDVQYVQEEK